MREPLISVANLKTYFHTENGESKAVDGVGFDICAGETLGLVGESGCGKSVTAASIIRLIPQPPGRIVDGQIVYKGRDLLQLSMDEMRDVRGNEISMIFQEPMTSLNPVFTVGKQISEVIRLHKHVSKREARDQSIEMLQKVGISIPERRVEEYPHQLSGGMRQRVMIAMALSCSPSLLIADEPTTALDVTIQAQILDLLNSLKEQFSMSVLMITHDLGVIAEVCSRVAVMYAGKIIEHADVKSLFADPKHPYTLGLMNSIPRMDEDAKRLNAIAGTVPSSYDFPKGCRYHTRCQLADERCANEEPRAAEVASGHRVWCWYHSAR